MVVNTFRGTVNLKPPSWTVDGIETPASLKGYINLKASSGNDLCQHCLCYKDHSVGEGKSMFSNHHK